MELVTGCLLVAHPVHADPQHDRHIVYITESHHQNTIGFVLNNLSDHTLSSLMAQRGIEWPWHQEVYYGGEYNPNAMIMMHSDNWYSRNTMEVGNNLSISSDEFMVEKMEIGDLPLWHRLFIGCKVWTPRELAQELKGNKPKWIVLPHPSQSLLEMDHKQQWQTAVRECSRELVATYF